MLRHRIVVEADLHDVVAALHRTDLVGVDTHELLKIVRFAHGIGTLRQVGEECVVDLFDDDDGAEVARLVDALRADGLVVHHETLT
jgi:hypothetical protein